MSEGAGWFGNIFPPHTQAVWLVGGNRAFKDEQLRTCDCNDYAQDGRGQGHSKVDVDDFHWL